LPVAESLKSLLQYLYWIKAAFHLSQKVREGDNSLQLFPSPTSAAPFPCHHFPHSLSLPTPFKLL
jgi:hypothetical protein